MTANAPEQTIGPGPGEVDSAIRSVLGDWFATRRARVERGGPSGRNPGPQSPRVEDVFTGRLLSLKQAETFPASLRAVRVAPGTVVTPLARDHLKRGGVEIRFVAAGEIGRIQNQGEWGFAIESVSGLVEAFRRSLLAESEAWHEVGTTLDDAVEWVGGGGTRGAMVLTDEGSVAVYRACQVPGVRAASAAEPEAVARAVRALGLNLLVIEPAGRSIALMRQLGATFRRAGGPLPPDWVARETTP